MASESEEFVIESTEAGEGVAVGDGAGEDEMAHAEFGDKHSSLSQKLPLLTVNAGPRVKKQWQARLKQEVRRKAATSALSCSVVACFR